MLMMVGKTIDIAALPYRCPKCNENADFSTLDGLRRHLAVDHSYRSPRGKAANGRTSPLTQCFAQQTEFLEHQLEVEQARISASQPYHTSAYSHHKHEGASVPRPQPDPGRYRYHMRNHSPAPRTEALSRLRERQNQSQTYAERDALLSVSDLDPPGFSLSQRSHQTHRVEGEGAEGRKEHWDVSDALAKARSHVDCLKATADHVAYQQEGIIKHLKSELEARDRKLDQIKKDLELLQGERHDLFRRVSMLSRENDHSAESFASLKDQVEEKDRLIREKNREVENLSLYVASVSKQQGVAKQRLEAYIADLLSRTHQAEATLQVGRESNTSPKRPADTTQLSRPVHLNTQAAGTPDMNSSWPGHHQGASGGGAGPQVNGHPSVSIMSQLATPTLTTLTVATPPSATPTLTSPLTSPDPSLLGTSGYLSLSTPLMTHNSTQMKNVSINSPNLQAKPDVLSPILTQATYHPRQGSLVNQDMISPLSPGEVILNQPQWFAPHPPTPNMGIGRGSNQAEGAESVKSGSSTAMPGQPSTQPSMSINLPVLTTDDHGILWDESNPISKRHPLPAVPRKDQPSRQPDTRVSSHNPLFRSNWKKDTDSALRWETFQLRQQLHNLKAQRRALRREGKAITKAEGDDSIDLTGVTDTETDTDTLGETDTTTQEGSTGTDYYSRNESWLHSRATGTRGSSPPTHREKVRRSRDALFCIFLYLDTRTLSQMALVCREWRDVSRHPALWRRVWLEKSSLSSKDLKTLARWSTQLQSLTLQNIRARPRRSAETVQQYQKITRGSLESGLEVLLKASRNNLLSLRIIDCGNILTERCLWLASCYSRLLQRVAYISDTDPVSTEVTWALGAGCRELTTLIIPPMYPNMHPGRFTNRTLHMVAACWPDLQVLCVGGVEVSCKGLTAVAKICSRLQVLELDHMCEVTEETAVSMCHHGLRGLESLDFTFTPVTPHALLHFASACPSLKTVNLHLGMSDYYKDTKNPNHQRAYHDTISKLRLVAERPGLNHIIHIKSDYP